jgi:hypothetical protein
LTGCAAGGGTPRLDAALPRSADAQAAAFVLIQGDHFSPDAVARLGSTRLQSLTWVNARLLTVELPPGMSPGNYGLVVQNPGGGEAMLPGALTITGPAAPPSAPVAGATQLPVAIARSATPTSPAAGRSASSTTPQATVTAAPTDISGRWALVDTVTNGPGTGAQFSFAITISQQGSAVSGMGSGLTLTGVIDGGTIRASYVQDNGSTGGFVWSLDATSGAFTGSFTNSIGNAGESVGQRSDSASPAPAQARPAASQPADRPATGGRKNSPKGGH